MRAASCPLALIERQESEMHWIFFHGVFGGWGWEQLNDNGEAIAESRGCFESREEAEVDGSRAWLRSGLSFFCAKRRDQCECVGRAAGRRGSYALTNTVRVIRAARGR